MPNADRVLKPGGSPAQTAAAPTLAMAKRIQTYETPEITVTFDPNKCRHSGVCVRGLPLVFDVTRKRWIQPEHAPAGEVAAQVSRCPSGALQYTLKSEDPSDERTASIPK